MSRYLLDTNHVGVAVDATTDLALQITESQRRGNRVGTCLPVLCEIQAGRMQVSHPQEYQRDLGGLLKQSWNGSFNWDRFDDIVVGT